MGGEDVTLEPLTKVLDHVVTLGLTMDVNVWSRLASKNHYTKAEGLEKRDSVLLRW